MPFIIQRNPQEELKEVNTENLNVENPQAQNLNEENPKAGNIFEVKRKSEFQAPPEADKSKEEDSSAKSIARWLYSIPSGIAQAVTYPIDLIQMIGTGTALDPEEIEQIRRISEQENIPFDEEKYVQSVQQAAQYFPTQSNIEGLIEEKTGFPATPKTPGQKLLKFASTAGKFSPGTLSQKAVAGGTAAATSGGLQSVGVPEPIAELIGLVTGGKAGSRAPKIRVEELTKPSGLPKRKFEKLKQDTVVSPSRIEKINKTLEGDFKKISNEILEESPIKKTKSQLEENPAFKQEIAEKFKEVESLAENIPEKFSSKEIKTDLGNKIKEKQGIGITPSGYEKDYKNALQGYIKDIKKVNITASEGVQQFRKNNKALSEIYEPGKSYAFNRAKKDALLDYNRAIANTFEKNYPNSEFSKLFKETNTRWSEIMDVEAINKFVDAMFDGEIKFAKGKKFFDNSNYSRPFKRALGDEGFKKYDQLMKDMLSSEKSVKMLKQARQQGFTELAETAGAYILHPRLGKLKLAYATTKKAYKGVMNAMLDQPQVGITWEKGYSNLKKGNFKAAEKDFKKLDTEVKKINQVDKGVKKVSEKKEALNKFKEHQRIKVQLEPKTPEVKAKTTALEKKPPKTVKKEIPKKKPQVDPDSFHNFTYKQQEEYSTLIADAVKAKRAEKAEIFKEISELEYLPKRMQERFKKQSEVTKKVPKANTK